MLTKSCSKCGEMKPFSEFHKNKSQKDGLNNQCKTCCSARTKQRTKEGYWPKHYRKYKESINKRSKEYYKKNHKQCRQNQREWYQNNREATLKQQSERYHTDKDFRDNKKLVERARKVNLSVDQYLDVYNKMYDNQNGCCAICGKPYVRFDGFLVLDHCHETGNLRGLLCGYCNTAIGFLFNSPDLCSKAAKYLE